MVYVLERVGFFEVGFVGQPWAVAFTVLDVDVYIQECDLLCISFPCELDSWVYGVEGL